MSGLLHEARCALPSAQVDEILDGFERAGFRLDPGAPSWARSDELIVVRAVRYDPAFHRQLAAAVASLRAAGEQTRSQSTPAHLPLPEGQVQDLLRRLETRRDRPREWLQVWDIIKMISTGIELHAHDDDDASSQLDALTEALPDLDRPQITIKPRRGWQGYGLPR